VSAAPESGRSFIHPGNVSVYLQDGETALLTKRSYIDAELAFDTRDGQFTVHESQYAMEGGTLIGGVADGVLTRKRERGRYIWIYRDSAPGSTDVYGPGVNTRTPSSALNRVRFGSPQSGFVGAEKCLEGNGTDKRSS
jgi:hypothetical protein